MDGILPLVFTPGMCRTSRMLDPNAEGESTRDRHSISWQEDGSNSIDSSQIRLLPIVDSELVAEDFDFMGHRVEKFLVALVASRMLSGRRLSFLF